jgi:peptidoglycan hydrolase-like amidase
VGLCQFSAQALAQRGWSGERILLNFYPGASLERAY